MTIKAKLKKNQNNLNKAVNWLLKHNEADKLRNIADGDGDEKAYNKADKRCQDTYDKFLDYMDELPKYEQNKVYNSDLY